MRSYQFLPYLEKGGFEVTICPLLDDEYCGRGFIDRTTSVRYVTQAYARRTWDTIRARRFDLLWIEKELFQWMPGPIEQLLLTGIPYVVDYDDAVFHTYDQHPSRSLRRLFGNKIAMLMRGARLVTAGNRYLAEYARRAGAPWVEVLPTVVDLEHYAERRPADASPFTIGWIGSPSTTKYLKLVEPVLAECCRPNGRVVLVGARQIRLSGVHTTIRSWSESTEVSDMLSFDVGIMPLPDEPWARGKCGYKLIQYMACGLPVVASPVGVNTELVDDGVDGFLAGGLERWVDALVSLRETNALRRSMGAAGRSKVERRYCSAVVGPQLVSLLGDVLA
jgi:glycosyltransferase involved in cell wall biosynthesis